MWSLLSQSCHKEEEHNIYVEPSPTDCGDYIVRFFVMICRSFCPGPGVVSLPLLSCGLRDVVLINSPRCTLIKPPLNGPAPSFPPGVLQDGSVRKQLQIYGYCSNSGRAVTERRLAAACRSNTLRFNMEICFVLTQSAIALIRSPTSLTWFAIAARNKVQSFFNVRRSTECAYCSAAAINNFVYLLCGMIKMGANLCQH